VNRNNAIGKHGKVVQKHFMVTVRVDSYYMSALYYILNYIISYYIMDQLAV